MNAKHLAICLATAGLLLNGCGSQSDSATEESTSTESISTTAASSTSSTPPSTLPLPTSPLATPAEETPSVEAPTALPSSPPAVPQANAPIDARSPEDIVASAGEKGQRYLTALRAAGIPPAGMDSAEILYADGTCKALAEGMPRPEVLAEFRSVGDVYSQLTPMSPQRIAEIYVETAEQTYC